PRRTDPAVELQTWLSFGALRQGHADRRTDARRHADDRAGVGGRPGTRRRPGCPRPRRVGLFIAGNRPVRTFRDRGRSMRSLIVVVFAAFTLASTSAQSGKKVFISADMEGISGISASDQL